MKSMKNKKELDVDFIQSRPLTEAVLPTPFAKLLLKNVERRIYSDISGYIRIYSDRKYIDRHLQSQDCFDYTN